MDGLECSEICYSKVRDSVTLRLDSDYYKKNYLKIEQYIEENKNSFVSLQSLGIKVDASAFYPSLEPYYNKGSIPFIRVTDVKTIIDYNNCIKIPKMGADFNTLYLVHKGDIVLTKGGRVGTAGLISRDSYVTRDLIFLSTSELSRVNYIALYLFFCTDFMYQQMIRSSSMTAQPHLTITLIRELVVRIFSANFKQKLSDLFDKSEELQNRCHESYKAAEIELLNTLEIFEPNANTSTVSIKKFATSFMSSGRLDAEYYQPKYDNYIASLNTKDTVNTLCNIHDKNFVPKADTKYMYIELANVGDSGNINDVEMVLGNNLPSRARRMVTNGQVIIASVEGSSQSCAIITDTYNGALCSTGFYVVDSDSINPESLLVLFKSELIQTLLKQRCSGTILTAIAKDEFLNMPLPKIDKSVQDQIATKVQESFALRHRSEQLLNDAKQAVEIAIEEGEKKAMEWLKRKKSK